MPTPETKKKKILVPIFNRAHYGRLRSVLRAIQNHPQLELQVMVGLPHAYGNLFETLKYNRPHSRRASYPWYFRAWLRSAFARFSPRALRYDFLVRHLTNDGFPIHSYVPLMLDGGTGETMARTVGLGLPKIAEELGRLRPEVVLVNADRFEMMAVALAAAYQNIPVAHNEGGDLSGTIDESVRHAITKLAHIHFTATEAARRRVIQMGENPAHVHAVGSPVIDVLQDFDRNGMKTSVAPVDIAKPFLLVLQHPVATEAGWQNVKAVEAVCAAIDELKMPAVFVGSNMDAQSNRLGLAAKEWMKRAPEYVATPKHLPPDDFYRLLAAASCAIGNSSSFIREGAYFGTPVVLVGSRQQGRERGKNIIEAAADKGLIADAVRRQMAHGRYPKDTCFGEGATGEKMAAILARATPPLQKQFHEA